MSKTKKILCAILIFTLLAALLTVAALATDGKTDVPVEFNITSIGDGSFSSFAPLDTVYDKPNKIGKYTAAGSDDGNVYLLSEYASTSEGGTDMDNWDITVPTANRTTYNFTKYPYVAFDYDIMTQNGTYGDYATVNVAIYSGSTRITTVSGLDFYELGLSANPYEWQHVTLIVEYTDSAVIYLHYYVNGVYRDSTSKNAAVEEAWTALDGDHSKLSVGYYRMYSSRSESKNGKIGFDNFKFTYFPKGYCDTDAGLAEIAAYHYSESYEFPYKYTVATIADSEGNVAYYDEITEAIEKAGENDVIKLACDFNAKVTVDKKITVDRNKYDADGNKTGELYVFEYNSRKAFVASESEDSGIFHFERSSEAIDVIWDEACSENCDCYAEFNGHALTDVSVVSLGEIPQYLGTVPTFDVENGYVKSFIGWSYTKGASSPDEILPLTEDDLERGYVKLYPVYSAVQYDFEVKDGSGHSEFYFKSDFDLMIKDALSTDKSTLILHRDIEYYTSVSIPSNVEVTLDLNGHVLTRINLYGETYRYDTELGDYVASDARATDLNAFNLAKTENSSFTVTSSNENAAFRTISANGSVYLDKDGKIESYTATAAGYAGFIFASQPKTVNINVSDIDLYAVNILYDSNGNTNSLHLNVDNVRFYKTAGAETEGKYGYGCIFIDTVNTVKVSLTDSLFYFPPKTTISGNGSFIQMLKKSSSSVSVVLDNCDIISDNNTVAVTLAMESNNATFNNCRVYNIKNNSSSFPSTLGNDTLTSKTIASNSKAADGCVIVSASHTVPYSLPTNSKVTVADGKPVFEFAFANRSISFTNELKLYREVYATVSWFNENGKLISTTEEIKNSTLNAPEYYAASGDGYRGAKVVKWLDEGGKEASLAIGAEDTYNFKAYPTFDSNSVYAAKITDAQFNFIFHESFTTVLYLPVTDIMTKSPTVSGFTGGVSTVKINGKEYWTYSKKNTTTGVSENLDAIVNFNIDGKSFSQTFTLNALLYAEIILRAPENDIEARAVANMVRYIKQARLAAGLEISDDFAKAEALYTLEPFKASDEYDSLGANVNDVIGYVESINFMLHGSTASYVFTLSSEAVEMGAVLSVEFADDGKEINIQKSDLRENSYYTEGTRVYDLTRLIRINVNVNGTDLSATYSIGEYINAMDNDLAKAIYEFGCSVSTYREYLIAKYNPTSSNLKTYKATFKADGITVAAVDFTICAETLEEPAIPEKKGYTGVWESYIITNKDITVNAVYTPIEYKINYVMNNAHAQHSNLTSYTVETETFEISDPVSEGDTFLGWYLDKDFTVKAPVSVTKGSTGEITFYANWECIHEIKVTDRKDPTPLIDGYETTNCVKCFSQEKTKVLEKTNSIKLLAIGNSFSIDALEYFGAILSDAGVQNITIANLYESGCSINGHLSNIESESAAYVLYLYNPTTKKMVSQGSSAENLVTVEYGLMLEDWDIITMQQASGHSPTPSLYSRVGELIDYVRSYRPNSKLFWHMTWAYDTWKLEGGEHGTSTVMYEKIVDAVNQMILTRDDFSLVIPAGTAVQNVRTSYIGDNMTRDGYHLSNGIGRYTAALTWFAYITGAQIDGISWTPSSYPEVAEDLAVIKEAVKNAVINPYKITDSVYTSKEDPVEPENPEASDFPTVSKATLKNLTADDIAYLEEKGFDPSDYKALVLNIQDDAFYNSTSNSKKATTGTLIGGFACTDIFGRDELIVGSIIRFSSTDENGNTYKYRPEGWTALDEKNEVRPDNTTAQFVVVDAEWWGVFKYRAFNINRSGITLEEAESVFIIYVPVSDAN